MADRLIQITSTTTANNPPQPGQLAEGELGAELGAPVRLWIGGPGGTGPAIQLGGQDMQGGASIGPTAPLNPFPGDLWYEDSADLRAFIWTGSVWVDFSPAGGGGGTVTQPVTVGAAPPAAPAEGDLWFDDAASNQLYVFDAAGAWTETSPAATGGGTGLDQATADARYLLQDPAADSVITLADPASSFIVNAAAAQTANILEVRDDGATTLFDIGPDGTVSTAGAVTFLAASGSNAINTRVPLVVRDAVGGTPWATVSDATGWAAGSDERLKEGIQPLIYGLGTVKALRPVSFAWKHDGKQDIGLIAQEVQGVVPEIVGHMPMKVDGTDIEALTLRKDALVAVLINAVQELASRLENLEGKV